MNKVIFIGKDNKYKYVEVADFSNVTLKIQDGTLVLVEQHEKKKPVDLLELPSSKKTVETLRNQLKNSFLS